MSSRPVWNSARGQGLVHPVTLQGWDVQGVWTHRSSG